MDLSDLSIRVDCLLSYLGLNWLDVMLNTDDSGTTSLDFMGMSFETVRIVRPDIGLDCGFGPRSWYSSWLGGYLRRARGWRAFDKYSSFLLSGESTFFWTTRYIYIYYLPKLLFLADLIVCCLDEAAELKLFYVFENGFACWFSLGMKLIRFLSRSLALISEMRCWNSSTLIWLANRSMI
jgi:hypothetical protein